MQSRTQTHVDTHFCIRRVLCVSYCVACSDVCNVLHYTSARVCQVAYGTEIGGIRLAVGVEDASAVLISSVVLGRT
jgi:hypothetical protein